MSDSKLKPKSLPGSDSEDESKRLFESESLTLQSLRLIAAPNPEDDLSDEELEAYCKSPAHSPELIQSLIDCIKAI